MDELAEIAPAAGMVEDFLTAEQVAIREMARDVAENLVKPLAAQIDEDDAFPRELIEEFGRLGLIQLAVPEEFGGAGGRVTEMCLVREEISRVSASAAWLAGNNTAGGVMPLLLGSTEEMRRRYLPELATGKHLTCIAMSESDAGSDVSAIRTTAVRDGDHYVVNGTKTFISSGPVASFGTVLAKTGPVSAGKDAISSFFFDASWKGISVGKKDRKLGMRGTPTGEIRFEDVRIPASHILGGGEGRGFALAMKVLNRNRPTVGAFGCGIARGAADYALAYTKERRAFGRAVYDFQATRFAFADMYMQIEAARSLLYRTAYRLDSDPDAPETECLSAMAKCFASEMCMRVAISAMEQLGGHGYMVDHPLERMMRDAKALHFLEGTNQIARIVMMRDK
ncbi:MULTISPECIES: acyl-CoA dehydrogenase family protein [Chelativorans]|jgi:alkylation response protein AidB-like acyl-CoA dehydrogenase|uniref:3-sulfinopropanoyl-CoA desulfinase n=1 Tax=Chelativorans sp. (strain BNC1) TaxID=266779 RepID=Q11D73_CHESB|nr:MULTISPECIES: acyl-CoA dehydrogenase family protein [Chelativorans]